MTKTNKKRGTSLVELLAVIVIMGIIAAIAVPTVGALLRNTRQKGAAADFTTMYQAAQTALIDDEDGKITAAELIEGEYVSINAADINGTVTFTQASNGAVTVTVSEGLKYTKDGNTYTITVDGTTFKAEEE